MHSRTLAIVVAGALLLSGCAGERGTAFMIEAAQPGGKIDRSEAHRLFQGKKAIAFFDRQRAIVFVAFVGKPGRLAGASGFRVTKVGKDRLPAGMARLLDCTGRPDCSNSDPNWCSDEVKIFAGLDRIAQDRLANKFQTDLYPVTMVGVRGDGPDNFVTVQYYDECGDLKHDIGVVLDSLGIAHE